MSAERLLALALLLPAAALALARAPVAALIAGVAAAAPLSLGPRLSLRPQWQRVLTTLLFIAGIGLGMQLPHAPGPNVIAREWMAVALGLVLAETFRLCLRAPEGGAVFSAVLGLLALTVSGEARLGAPYAAMVAAHLVLALLALRTADGGRPALTAIPRRSLALGAALLVASGAAFAGLSRSLPPLAEWTQGQFVGSGRVVTGFSDRLWLGALDGMLQSDALVMRLEGERGAEITHLRGAVYDHYDEEGRWGTLRRAAAGERRPTLAAAPPAPVRAARLTLLGGARDRYFLPLEARGVAPRDEGGSLDRYGIIRFRVGAATLVDFDLGGPPEAAPPEPSPEDLAVPEALRPELSRIAAAWTAGAPADPRARVAAIAARLEADYAYSLSFSRQRGRDPLLDFLQRDRRGHCEYFASAMTLLARSAGVPARLVVGYRTAETSPFGGHVLVREQDAHAWTEVLLPGGGWVTVDATPPAGSLGARRTPFFAALADWLSVQWTAASAALADRALPALAGVAVLLGVGIAVRQIRRRRPAARRAAALAPEAPPPAELEALLAALARRRLARGMAEPLEGFARRLEAAGLGEAATAIDRYAALRYGGIGDPQDVLAALSATAARLRA